MKKTLFVIWLLMIVFVTYAEESKDKYDFLAPEPREDALFATGTIPLDPKTGIIISSVGTALGVTATFISIKMTLNESINHPYGSDLQRNVVLTGASLVGSAVFSILLDYFIDRIREDSTSGE